MANLEFCDKHNMVAYLKKPTGSEGFQEIVDFLNGSHIRFALTKNPTIYVSPIEKFWQTATVRTVDNGEQEITATIDGKEFTITEASGIRNVPPNGVFGNEVYGSDSEGFGMNPSSNEFRLCNSDEWRSGNHGGRVIIRGYGGGGDMVVRHGLKGCLDHRIIRSSPILPPLP
ncbi:hypothetical protein Tco_1473646 [Tanacetum coccineum]